MDISFKGSQINGGNSDYGRVKSDFYPTPPDATQALLNFLNIPKGKTIWEPACGEGHMAEVFRNNAYTVVASDINDLGYGEPNVDFTTTQFKECDWIITNPPFNLATEFIQACSKFDRPFALLLKSQFWHSKKRSPLFETIRPKYILPLTWRPDFLFKERGSGSPLMDVLWTVWDSKPCDSTQYQILKKPTNL